MKPFTLNFAAFLLLLTGCHFYTYNKENLQKSAIPPDPQSNRAILVPPGDSLRPTTTIVRVAENKLYFNPDIKENVIVDSLANISMHFGYDMIKIDSVQIKEWEESYVEIFDVVAALMVNAEASPEYTLYKSREVKYRAYKYLDNINPEKIIYAKKLYRKETDGNLTAVATEFLMPSGERKAIAGDNKLYDHFRAFDLTYCLEEVSEDWNYRLTKKKALIRKNRQHHIKTKFDRTGSLHLPVEIMIKERLPEFRKYQMSLFFDRQNTLKSLEIMEGGKRYASINYLHDESGKITREIIHLKRTDQHFEIIYQYYNKEKLREALLPLTLVH